MYTFKLLDIVVQGFAFLTAIILLLTFNVYGYFYWIKAGLVVWIMLSAILNPIVYKPLSSLRKIVSFMLFFLLLVFIVLFAVDIPTPQLNYYFQPLSYLIVIGYFIISLLELNTIKKNGEIDLDF